MNLTYAVTEPYARFQEFREGFDRNIRVTYGGLQALRSQSLSSAKEGSVEVPTGDEPWGKPRHWRQVPQLTKQATTFLSHMGVVRVMSAFEDFLGNTKAEYDRFDALTRPVSAPPGDTEGSDGLRALCQQLAWSTAKVARLLPLLEYFTAARNCIAHRDGRASRAFVEFATDDKLASAVAHWNENHARPLPTFPLVRVNREIAMLPRHAVLASIVCNKLACFIDEHLKSFLGDAGMIYMAAWHAVLSPDSQLGFEGRSVDAVINRVLFERYRVQEFTSTDTIQTLRRLNRWKPCYTRFTKLANRDHPVGASAG